MAPAEPRVGLVGGRGDRLERACGSAGASPFRHWQLNHLPAGQQRQVLDLFPLAGAIGADDLAAISQAVADCEGVDAHGW